jgi:16S rRNA processing protein RimM
VAEGGYLAVARLKKPHGLKGEAVLWALTDEPDEVLAAGRELTPIDEAGNAIGEPVVIERSRPYQRQWLVKFVGIADRPVLEGWPQRVFGVLQSELRQPEQDELYLHEVPGTRILVGGTEIGVARELMEMPGGGRLLVFDVEGKEMLVPFQKPIVKRVDRSARLIELDPPEGLLEL